MEQCVLAVGYNKEKYNEIQKEWLKYGMCTHREIDLTTAILALSRNNCYLLIDIFVENKESLVHIKTLRELTQVPILIVRNEYDSVEKILAIDSGVDEYIPVPGSAKESVASGRALIRRYKMLEQGTMPSSTVLCCGDLLLYVEYRKAFVCGKEITFTRQEYDFLCLLLKGIGRVYTHEQILEHIWGAESETRGTNAIWNLVSRLRTKIVGTGGDDKILQTVRDVGYRIDMVKTA